MRIPEGLYAKAHVCALLRVCICERVRGRAPACLCRSCIFDGIVCVLNLNVYECKCFFVCSCGCSCMHLCMHRCVRLYVRTRVPFHICPSLFIYNYSHAYVSDYMSFYLALTY
eukprot:GEMP01108135.1.p1 GENE.GEMP01108135.1~~GEMP01108135.1.p1  ORF type:complete len:113 (+),score=0.16 GEMP01108135.1:285-623(+)